MSEQILVLPDQAASKTSGDIVLPDDVVERQTLAAESGVLVDLGERAFEWMPSGRRWEGGKPKPGDRVAMGRYSGQLLTGDDGKQYRLMSDSCIGAVRPATPFVIGEFRQVEAA